jgi:two-component system cell cycle response regulator DivK
VKTILIVEDVELNRDLLIQLLEDRYRLVVAQDGETAIERASDESPDLILMDLSLPRMDGWEATRKLKADRALSRIPVVALSAHAMRAHEERARESGCDAFLTKPIDETLLYRTLARYLGD